jgi:hypothetical protein
VSSKKKLLSGVKYISALSFCRREKCVTKERETTFFHENGTPEKTKNIQRANFQTDTVCAAYIGIGGMKIEDEPRH